MRPQTRNTWENIGPPNLIFRCAQDFLQRQIWYNGYNHQWAIASLAECKPRSETDSPIMTEDMLSYHMLSSPESLVL